MLNKEAKMERKNHGATFKFQIRNRYSSLLIEQDFLLI